MSNETCPHCGAEKEPAGRKRIEIVVGFYTERDPIYKCGSCIDENWRHPNCYERQIEQLKQIVLDEREACAEMVDHIYKEGGGTYGKAIRARGNVK